METYKLYINAENSKFVYRGHVKGQWSSEGKALSYLSKYAQSYFPNLECIKAYILYKVDHKNRISVIRISGDPVVYDVKLRYAINQITKIAAHM